MTDVDPRWYDGFFEADWLDYLQPEADVTLRQVDFVVERLELEPGESVIDVACGRGRHSVELARRGFRVTGIDLSPRSLELARAAAADAGVDVELRHLDMRALDYDRTFDAAINLFTAFGYFDDDAANELVVHGIADALRPGGRFLIDTINPIALAPVFRERDWREFDDGSILVERRWRDQLRGRGGGTWSFVRGSGSRSTLEHSIRMYAPWELRSLLEAAGFEVDGAWGSFEATELGEGTRTILRARKRE